jgi:hypothetical protein
MKAMDDRVQRSGMDQLILEPHGLYVFVDDTGHERLAGQDFYGLGGCAFRGADYDRLIRGPWSLVRFVVNGNMDAPLHATDFGRTATPQQIEEVVRFFREKPFMRIAAAGATTTALPEYIPLMRVVIESLKQRIVEVAKYQPFMSISVIFEANQRADPDLQAYFGDVRFRVDGHKVPTNCYLMPKNANEPALEVADFVANAVGGHARRTLVQKRDGFGQDFKAVFHGIDRRLVSFMGIERVEINSPANAEAK